MKRIYTSDNAALAWHIRNILEQHQIEAFVKNDQLYSVSGEIPTTECWPEVWVADEGDVKRAEQLVADFENPGVIDGEDWICSTCGEDNAVNFKLCWNCQQGNDLE